MNKDTFTPHGYYTLSNAGGYEVEIADSNDAARVRYNDGEVSDWLEITYRPNEDDPDEDEPVIDEGGLDIPLNLVMRI